MTEQPDTLEEDCCSNNGQLDCCCEFKFYWPCCPYNSCCSCCLNHACCLCAFCWGAVTVSALITCAIMVFGASGGGDGCGNNDCGNVCDMLMCCCIFEHCPCYGDLPVPNGEQSGHTIDELFNNQQGTIQAEDRRGSIQSETVLPVIEE